MKSFTFCNPAHTCAHSLVQSHHRIWTEIIVELQQNEGQRDPQWQVRGKCLSVVVGPELKLTVKSSHIKEIADFRGTHLAFLCSTLVSSQSLVIPCMRARLNTNVRESMNRHAHLCTHITLTHTQAKKKAVPLL